MQHFWILVLYIPTSHRVVKPNKVEKVLAESKPNPTVNQTFKLKKIEDSPRKQKTTKHLSLKTDVLTFCEVKFGTCDTLNERNTLLTYESKGRCQVEEATTLEDNGRMFNSAETRVHNVLENETAEQNQSKRLLLQLFLPCNSPAVCRFTLLSINDWCFRNTKRRWDLIILKEQSI